MVGVVAVVFRVFFLDGVLQRLMQQIIEAWVVHEEEIVKVFSQDWVNWDHSASRFVEVWRGSDGAVLRRVGGF